MLQFLTRHLYKKRYITVTRPLNNYNNHITKRYFYIRKSTRNSGINRGTFNINDVQYTYSNILK